jgi:hypothetical protein
MKQIILSLAFLLNLSAAAADDVVVRGHTYSRAKTLQGARWSLQGTHHFSVRLLVKISVFTGAYYEQVDGAGRHLKFTYTRDLKAKDLTAKAMEALREQNDEEELARWKTKLDGIQSAYVDVKEGDSYTITAIPGQGTWLHLNGEELFASEDGDFGLWYLDIWLGDPPIDAGLKKALMEGEG